MKNENINFSNSTIIDSILNVGTGNKIIVGNSNNDYDYYSEVIQTMNELLTSFDKDKFQKTFSDNSEIINDTIKEVIKHSEKKDKNNVKKALDFLKSIVVEVSGSTIAQMILTSITKYIN